jgi:hypothetical protein
VTTPFLPELLVLDARAPNVFVPPLCSRRKFDAFKTPYFAGITSNTPSSPPYVVIALQPGKHRREFPKGFYWGVATASSHALRL